MLTFSALFYPVSNIDKFQIHFLSRSLPEAQTLKIFAGLEHRIFAVHRGWILAATTFDGRLTAFGSARDKIFHRLQPLAIPGYCFSIFLSHVRPTVFVMFPRRLKVQNLCNWLIIYSLLYCANFIFSVFLGNLRFSWTGWQLSSLNRSSC